MGHSLRGQKEGGTQVAPPIEKQKGCVSTNTAEESPNGRHSKYLMPKSKPVPLRGKGGQRENIKTWRTTWRENLISHKMLLMSNNATLGK